MSTSTPRRLIVNADDFGQTAGINEGIIHCHERGIVTSTSLMVHWPWASAAAGYARRTPTLSVGLHLDLGEWVYRNGQWCALYEIVAVNDPCAVRSEVVRQLDTFRQLMGSDPTHVDSHQHVHGRAIIKDIVGEMTRSLGVPLRCADERITYVGEFYGQERKGTLIDHAITVEHLAGLLRALPDGTTELSCHPGLGGDAHGMYVAERAEEARVLCDPRVRAVIEAEGIALTSFHTRPGWRPLS
jgi:predicted glycoside hydrolase/deacetylase ChbG (UPF0249 family)